MRRTRLVVAVGIGLISSALACSAILGITDVPEPDVADAGDAPSDVAPESDAAVPESAPDAPDERGPDADTTELDTAVVETADTGLPDTTDGGVPTDGVACPGSSVGCKGLTPQCCSATDGGFKCRADGSVCSPNYYCDDRADCPPGEFCCSYSVTSSACMALSACSFAIFCTTDAECVATTKYSRCSPAADAGPLNSYRICE
jgi:hypothetical protein